MKKFKKGQWLISRYKKDHGGETVLTKYIMDSGKHHFIQQSIIMFSKEYGVQFFSTSGTEPYYYPSSKSIQWRPATKSELKKYAMIIFNIKTS